MDLTNAESNVGKVAGILGVIQGMAWLAMSLICIVLYNKGVDFDCASSTNSHLDNLNRNLYFWFLNKDYTAIGDVNIILTPHSFTIFMWLYAFIGFGWILVSLLQYSAITINSSKTRNVLIGWSTITILILILDLVLSILLGVDFNSCKNGNIGIITCPGQIQIVNSQILYDTIMPVLIIAGRGYVLWIINLILVTLLLKTTKDQPAEFIYRRGLMSNNRIPRATLQKIPNYYTPDATLKNTKNVDSSEDDSWPRNPKGFNDGSFPSTPAIYSSQHNPTTTTKY